MIGFSLITPSPRPLKTEKEFDQFSLACQKWMGVRFPLEYLKNNRVIGFFNREQQLIGGFALITQYPFRVIQSIPQQAQKKIELLGIRPDFLFEITGLWLHPEHKNRLTNLYFYLNLYMEIRALKKSHFIYAFSSSKPKLGKIYSVAQPITIYQGPTEILPGMNQADDEVIQVGSVNALHKVWISNPGFLFNRLRRTRSASFHIKSDAIEL